MRVISDINIHNLVKQINEAADQINAKKLASDLKIYCDNVGADYSEICKLLKLKTGGLENLSTSLIAWLDKNIGGGNWTINQETGKIDVEAGTVYLRKDAFENGRLPKEIEFGNFNADLKSVNCELESLQGFPKQVKSLDISYNRLESLENCPQILRGAFNCSYNRKLKSLEGGPTEVRDSYDCSNCNLESLEGAPKKVGYTFSCNGNDLKSLEGGPESVEKYYNCFGNKLSTLKGIAQEFDGYSQIDCSENELYTLEGINLDLPMLPTVKAKKNLMPENILLSTYGSARRYGSWVAAYLVLITTNTFQRMSKQQRDPIRDELSQENLKKKQIGLSKLWKDPIMENPAIQRIIKKENLSPEATKNVERSAGLSDIGF